jgi:hypothetical protein
MDPEQGHLAVAISYHSPRRQRRINSSYHSPAQREHLSSMESTLEKSESLLHANLRHHAWAELV